MQCSPVGCSVRRSGRSAFPPVYLQWAGHAVVIVGAVRRKLSMQAKTENFLLIFNPESPTIDVHGTLHRPEPPMPSSAHAAAAGSAQAAAAGPDPSPPWWKHLAWPALKSRSGPRILLGEAIQHSAGMPGPQSEKGPGGVDGPYQTMHVPPGFVVSATERRFVFSPEHACTQHVGDAAPLVLKDHPTATLPG